MKLRVGEQEIEEGAAEVRRMPDGSLRVTIDGRAVTAWVSGDDVWIEGRTRRVAPVVVRRAAAPTGEVTPPMPGAVTRIFVAVGDAVTTGDKLVAISAMKLETVLRAPKDGVVTAVNVAVGAQVKPGQKLVEVG